MTRRSRAGAHAAAATVATAGVGRIETHFISIGVCR